LHGRTAAGNVAYAFLRSAGRAVRNVFLGRARCRCT